MKYLNIYGHRVKLKEVSLSEENYAVCDFNSRQILIDPKAHKNKDEYMQTLLHEVFHYVWRRCGIIQSKISYEAEEIIVESFSTAIVENFDVKLKGKSPKS